MVWDGGDGNSAVPLCCASPSAEAGQGLAFKVEVWNACAGHLCVQSSSTWDAESVGKHAWSALRETANVGRSEPPRPYVSITVRAGLLEAGEHCLGSPCWKEEGWHTLGKGSLRQMALPVLFCSCAMNVPLWIPIKDAECLKTRVNKPTQVLMEMHPSQTGLDPITIKVFYFLEFWHQRVDFQDK